MSYQKDNTKALKSLIERLKTVQSDGEIHPCPRCGLAWASQRTALSRQADVYICDQCGQDEALRDMSGHPFDFTDWRCDDALMELGDGDYSDGELEVLWDIFGDIPMNPETECLDDDFLHFPRGTSREDIWHWFDEHYSRGVAALFGFC